jgi:DNA mismatch repair protein MSH2
MLYKVQEGVIDRSYGIHVAEMLKFDESVIKEASYVANMLENFNNDSYKPEAAGMEG